MISARSFALALVFIGSLGCGGESPVSSDRERTAQSVEQQSDSRSFHDSSQRSPTHPTASSGKSSRSAIEVTAAAAAKIRVAMEETTYATHLIVEVDVDDEKYCAGFHYKLAVGGAPSRDEFEMSESNGIKLAVEKRNLRFLVGTTIDYERRPNGVEGFKFHNPNEQTPTTPSRNSPR